MKIKNSETLERQYESRGVTVLDHCVDFNGNLIATKCCCRTCGLIFSPDAKRIRNRHICEYGCNRHLSDWHIISALRRAKSEMGMVLHRERCNINTCKRLIESEACVTVEDLDRAIADNIGCFEVM